MAPRPNRLPIGITRVHPHSRRTLRTAAELAACPNWVWRVRVRRRGRGDFDQLYPQTCQRDSARNARLSSARAVDRRARSQDGTRNVQRLGCSPTTLIRTWPDGRVPPTTTGATTTWTVGGLADDKARSVVQDFAGYARARRTRAGGVEAGHGHPKEEWTASTALVIRYFADTSAAPVEPVCRALSRSAESGARAQGSTAAKVTRGREGATDGGGHVAA